MSACSLSLSWQKRLEDCVLIEALAPFQELDIEKKESRHKFCRYVKAYSASYGVDAAHHVTLGKTALLFEWMLQEHIRSSALLLFGNKVAEAERLQLKTGFSSELDPPLPHTEEDDFVVVEEPLANIAFKEKQLLRQWVGNPALLCTKISSEQRTNAIEALQKGLFKPS